MTQKNLEPPGVLSISAALAGYVASLNTWVFDRVSGAEFDEFDAQEMATLAPESIRPLVAAELTGRRGCVCVITVPDRHPAGVAARWLSSAQLDVKPAAVFFYGSDGLLEKPLHPSQIEPGGTLHVLALAPVDATGVLAQVQQRVRDLETTTFDQDGYSLPQAS